MPPRPKGHAQYNIEQIPQFKRVECRSRHACLRKSSPTYSLMMSTPSSRVVSAASPRGSGAGPRLTTPVAVYSEPWHGHPKPAMGSGCTRQPR